MPLELSLYQPAAAPDVCRVTGVSLLDPRGCLPTLSLPLTSMVLYGRNASGKSTLLRHLTETLSGGWTAGAESLDLVHVRAFGPLDGSGGLGFWLSRVVLTQAERAETRWLMLRHPDNLEPPDPDAPEPPDPEALEPPGPDATIEQLVAYLLWCDGAGEELAVAVARQNSWTLSPRQLRPEPAGVGQGAVPQDLLAHVDQRVGAALPRGAAVLQAVLAREGLQSGQRDLALTATDAYVVIVGSQAGPCLQLRARVSACA